MFRVNLTGVAQEREIIIGDIIVSAVYLRRLPQRLPASLEALTVYPKYRLSRKLYAKLINISLSQF